ncbi:RAMP superfamily CRISPR-associated protein [Mitsuokella sp. WILCCON 0060]|uniref:RAMP superfamily CRISPR-associated protein n=1 Tax=Mitsuokella sp. WILCCON 0060 TaxID=3345341 RepID=UPI003F1B3781
MAKHKMTPAERRKLEAEKRKNRGKQASEANREKQLKAQGQQEKPKYKKNPSSAPVQPNGPAATGVAPKKTWQHEENIEPLTLAYKSSAKMKEIDFGAPITIRVQSLSPIHLGSGQADVNVDAEVIHDDVGLPYFPAKRFKGLLYESALEVAEMSELAGLKLLDKAELDELFQHGCLGRTQLIVPNLYLEGYDEMHENWQALEENFPALFQPSDVLEQYTSLRYQTKIDRETGTAADTSLHNMRVVDEGLCFTGTMTIEHSSRRAFEILALALRNLSRSGLKRTRGFGHIACTMEQNGKDILRPLLREILH